MKVTDNLKQSSIKAFANAKITVGSEIYCDGYRSYLPALKDDYTVEARPYSPDNKELHWLHVIISNAKSVIQGTFHGIGRKYLQPYLDEFCYHFSRRHYRGRFFDRLVITMATSHRITLFR